MGVLFTAPLPVPVASREHSGPVSPPKCSAWSAVAYHRFLVRVLLHPKHLVTLTTVVLVSDCLSNICMI